jgi:hypothetical protein
VSDGGSAPRAPAGGFVAGPCFAFDRERLREVAAQRRDEFRRARPFPHVVIDGLVPDEVLDAVVAEFPSPDRPEWFRFDSELERKLASTTETPLGPATVAVLTAFNSAAFLDFLTELTGMPGLVPDPHFVGGGLHQIVPGGHLEVHADFDRHPTTGLERRLNVLLYLNRGWREEWNGALELWGPDLRACEARIWPEFNRCVVFETTATSYHGHPAPLACPPGQTRKSLALYYYALPTRDDPPHGTLFRPHATRGAGPRLEPSRPSATRRAEALDALAKRAAEELLPPVVLRTVRAAVRRRRARRAGGPGGSGHTDGGRPGGSQLRARDAAPRGPGGRAHAPRGGEATRRVLDPSVLFVEALSDGAPARPAYLWGTLLAAATARGLRADRVGVVELGVAGGNGLVALEEAASVAERLCGVAVEVAGLDTGTGMPPPRDPRDAPFVVAEGLFPMDVAALRARLSRAVLVLGPVAETVHELLASVRAPLGFVAFDLDYYTSTVEALALLEAGCDALLPRVVCYFDDVLGYGWTDFMGARAAIEEFNASHERRKIGRIHGLRYELPAPHRDEAWVDKLYLAHVFDHPRYAERCVQLPREFFDAHRLNDAR